jgi:5S rRNA maturation endonuclease (ribonuclease M5)
VDPITSMILPQLTGIRPSGGSWMARCPAHEDGTASLHISRGTTQPVVLKCHAGCDPADILGAIGLTWEALCEPRGESAERGEWTPGGPAVAVYDYTDEAGKILYQVLRTADKKFFQRIPDASRKTGWNWKLGSTRRVLYRLPKVIEAVQAGEIIFIAEGEKDVQALERAGVTATCNSGGCGAGWDPRHTEFLRDAIVRIIADCDQPGQAHARKIAEALESVAVAVEIAEAAAGKDAAAHLAAGRAVADFVITKDASIIAMPELAQDLLDFIAESDAAEDWVIPGLLERGDRLIWTGIEGLGKTVVTRQIAVAAAAGIHPFTNVLYPPRKVLFIDCENPVRKSRRRFREVEEIARRFKRRPLPEGGFRIIHRPQAIDLSREEEAAWLIERVTAHKPDLLVIGPLYKLHALDINDELAARAITSVLDQARAQVDCAVIIEGHAPHGDNGVRALRPVGSSLFMRWPEFGYGIRRAPATKDDKATKRRVVVQAWRGPREERAWPKNLEWGREGLDWPWVPYEVEEAAGLHAVSDAV